VTDLAQFAQDGLSLTLADGRAVPVAVRKSSRARRILLHVGTYDGAVELVLPPGCPVAEGVMFARTQTGWIARQLSRIGAPVPFAEGKQIPLLGQPITIRREPSGSALPVLIDNMLIVGGREDTVAGRVGRWFRARARSEIDPRAQAMGADIGRLPNKITVRDTRSRWGSCTRAGNLNFSWRLVMAPAQVLNYVVAHEVAHLRELNHSDRFWRVVADICPDHKDARRWLKTHGASLHRYGKG